MKSRSSQRQCENSVLVPKEELRPSPSSTNLPLRYTHSPVARTFFCCTVCLRTFTHLHACAQARMAQVVSKRCLLHMCHLSPSRFLLLMVHPSSLLLVHDHFETTPDFDLTDADIHKILPYLPVLKAQDTRNCAPASRSLATWPDQMQTHLSGRQGHWTRH